MHRVTVAMCENSWRRPEGIWQVKLKWKWQRPRFNESENDIMNVNWIYFIFLFFPHKIYPHKLSEPNWVSNQTQQVAANPKGFEAVGLLICRHDFDTCFFCFTSTVHRGSLITFSASLLCSVEKPTHAHRDQLFHSESLSGGRAGDHHLPAGQPRSGHHGDVVLWRNPLQNCALLAGRTFKMFNLTLRPRLDLNRQSKKGSMKATLDIEFHQYNMFFCPRVKISKQIVTSVNLLLSQASRNASGIFFFKLQLHRLWYMNLK